MNNLITKLTHRENSALRPTDFVLIFWMCCFRTCLWSEYTVHEYVFLKFKWIRFSQIQMNMLCSTSNEYAFLNSNEYALLNFRWRCFAQFQMNMLCSISNEHAFLDFKWTCFAQWFAEIPASESQASSFWGQHLRNWQELHPGLCDQTCPWGFAGQRGRLAISHALLKLDTTSKFKIND